MRIDSEVYPWRTKHYALSEVKTAQFHLYWHKCQFIDFNKHQEFFKTSLRVLTSADVDFDKVFSFSSPFFSILKKPW